MRKYYEMGYQWADGFNTRPDNIDYAASLNCAHSTQYSAARHAFISGALKCLQEKGL